MPESPDQYSVWFNSWMALLYGALGVFSIVAVVVTIKGWKEIKVMLQKLKQNNAAQ
mgnify:CR=1 FL=1